MRKISYVASLAGVALVSFASTGKAMAAPQAVQAEPAYTTDAALLEEQQEQAQMMYAACKAGVWMALRGDAAEGAPYTVPDALGVTAPATKTDFDAYVHSAANACLIKMAPNYPGVRMFLEKVGALPQPVVFPAA